MAPLPVSVVVVARNAEATIEECLTSARRNQPAEIIVVDGRSRDRTMAIAEKYADRVFSDDGLGLAYARQLGVEQAKQEYVAYVDSDVFLPEGTLATLQQELEASGYAAISAQLHPARPPHSYWAKAVQKHVEIIFTRQGILALAASFFRRDTLLKYGFDPSFPKLDDTQLFRRLRADGCRYGVSTAVAHGAYKSAEDFKSFARQRFTNGRSKAQFLWKYGPHHLPMWAPLTMAYMVGLCLIRYKPQLLPYFIVGGMVETAGMAKGFVELLLARLDRQRFGRGLT